jgi:hypothetical protein
MNDTIGRTPGLTPAAGVKASTLSLLVQIAALVLGFTAAAWGGFSVYGAAFPGPCGENVLASGLIVTESWLLDLPVGLLVLLVGLFVRKGSPRLRRICVITSLVTLCLPALSSYLLQLHHCP